MLLLGVPKNTFDIIKRLNVEHDFGRIIRFHVLLKYFMKMLVDIAIIV